VLVADDERIIADTLAMILKQSGFDARAAYSGTMAVEMAQNFKPNLVIFDVVMPEMTGVDAAIQVQSMLPSCKVLLFSGQVATADLLEKARNEGYKFDILSKPVHPKDLTRRFASPHSTLDRLLGVYEGTGTPELRAPKGNAQTLKRRDVDSAASVRAVRRAHRHIASSLDRAQKVVAFCQKAIDCFSGTRSVDSPTASTRSTAFLRYANLDGSHLWQGSAESKSASQVAVATVTKHCLQMESVVPSGLNRRTKPDWDDAAMVLNLRGFWGPLPRHLKLFAI